MVERLTRRRLLKVAGLVAFAPAVVRWSPARGANIHGHAMGMSYQVQIPDESFDQSDVLHLRNAIRTSLGDVESRVSLYRTDSELSRFNAHKAEGHYPLSDRSAAVVRAALELKNFTEGAFDPASGPLVRYWSFGPEPGLIPDASKPPPEQILESVTDANIRWVTETPGTLHKGHVNAEIDLNGIAKGDAVDRIAGILDEKNLSDYLVELGGEIRTCGNDAGGRPWFVGVAESSGPQEAKPLVTLRLGSQSIATSGDYQKYFVQNGRRYSHVIDPGTGRPVEHDLSSVSVVADSCARADALATALLVMGPDNGRRFAEENAIAAFFVRRSTGRHRVVATKSFKRLIAEDEGVAG